MMLSHDAERKSPAEAEGGAGGLGRVENSAAESVFGHKIAPM
jgi:hypothetical protein